VRWIKQPSGSSLCGQIAVAVVADVDLDYAIRRGFGGSRNGTSTRRIDYALRLLGVHPWERDLPRLRLQRTRTTDVAIAKLSFAARPSWSRAAGGFVERRPSRWHWVVLDGDLVWDGVYGNKHGAVDWPDGAKVTSYLPVTPREPS
jgi:hypothetical protein